MDASRDAASRVRIDLASFKLHASLLPGHELTLHFDTPSRRFYLSLIALVVVSAHAPGARRWVPMSRHADLLALLNETVGEGAGSSDSRTLLRRVYRKWKSVLPDLAAAPLFRILGRHAPDGRDGARLPHVSDAECDLWANLFEYRGSEENVQLRMAFERAGIDDDSVLVQYREACDQQAWVAFVDELAKSRETPGSVQRVDVPVPARRSPWRRSRIALGAVAAVVVAAALGALYPMMRPVPDPPAAVADRPAYPALASPVVAVRPFASLSGDESESLQAGGFTIELVAALSRVPELVVVTLPAADRPVESTLGEGTPDARHLLQGSLGRDGERLRVSVQLVDTEGGRVVWSGRFDRTGANVLEILDEVTIRVVTALQGRLTVGDYARLWSGRTRNVDAYLKYLETISLIARHNRAANLRARRVAEEVIALDGSYPRGHVALAQTHLWDILLGISESPRRSLDAAIAAASTARGLDERDPAAVGVLASSHLMARQHDLAIELVRIAVDLDPNAPDSRLRQGFVLLNAGRAAQAVEAILEAGRRSPNVYFQPYYYLHLATAYRLDGQYEQAVRVAREAVGRLPDNLLIRLQLTAASQQAARTDEARAQALEVLRINPSFTLDWYRSTLFYRDSADVERTIDALRASGLR